MSFPPLGTIAASEASDRRHRCEITATREGFGYRNVLK